MGMQIGIITDELSADPETAIELGTSWGVHAFELRGFGTQRAPLYSDFQKARIAELLDQYGAHVMAISPGLFKCALPASPRPHFPLRTFDQTLYQQWRSASDLFAYHRQELLPLSIEYALEVGAKIIVAFSGERAGIDSENPPEQLLEAFYDAAQQVGDAGLQLAVEVESDFWCDTGANTARFIEAVNHPALGVNWDPGNAFVAGDIPYPNGYQAVRPHIRHVHFKDVVKTDRFHYAVEGDIDWSNQILALARDNYQGYISVETHMTSKVANAHAMTKRLQKLIASAEAQIARQ